jgi:hypothetical protein
VIALHVSARLESLELFFHVSIVVPLFFLPFLLIPCNLLCYSARYSIAFDFLRLLTDFLRVLLLATYFDLTVLPSVQEFSCTGLS